MLRRDQVLEKEMTMMDQDCVKELGHLSLVFKLKIENFEDQIYEDVREIEKYYFDPFNSNEHEVQKNLGKIQDLVKKKHDVMNQKMEQLDKRNEAMRTLAVDLAYLRKTHQDLMEENAKMTKRITQLQNVDEVHIEIDVLANTPQGVATLRQKYAKLIKRYELEKTRYDALEKEYFKIEPQLAQIKKLRTQIEEVKRAGEEQEFHLGRYKDLANRVKAQKETILSQEEIIQNLSHSIKAQTKEGPQENVELNMQLGDLRYKRERLQHRLKQLKLLTQMNDGKLPRDYQEKIKEEEISENKEEVDRLRKYEDQLLTMIQDTSRQLDALGPKLDNYYRSNQNFFDKDRQSWEREKEGLNIQLNGMQAKGWNLERQLQSKTQSHAKNVSDLKYQITMAQARIDEKAALLY